MKGPPSEQAPPDRRWRVAGVVASVAIVLSIAVYLLEDVVLGDRTSTAAAPTFVGRARCGECHEPELRAFAGSDHDRAMDVANDSTVLGDFDDVTFEAHGITSRFYRKSGKHYVWTEGPGGVMGEFEVAYVFGYDPLQQYLIPFPDGRLQALSIAWDVAARRWFSLHPEERIAPGDWLHWTRNAQNWNGMCAQCHSTNLVKAYDPATKTFGTTWSEIDVSCEACHGPGSSHVTWAERPPTDRPGLENDGLAQPTSGITARQQVELCAPCHARRTELGPYDHTSRQLLDTHLPAVLSDPLYFADGQIRDEVYEYGSFTQSRMFRSGVRCGDCHDVHSLKLREDGNALCAQCHRADLYDTTGHHFHEKIWQGKPSDAARCVKCHMPERPYMVIDWRADHSLRVPRPDLTLALGVPNACAQSGCHDDRPVAWSADAYRTWYRDAPPPHYGQVLAAGRAGRPGALAALIRLVGDTLDPAIVRATALTMLTGYPGDSATAALSRALGDADPLIRYTALASLNTADRDRYVEQVVPLLVDGVKAVRIEAAAQLAGVPRELLAPDQRAALDTATAEYVRAMEYSLDFASNGHNLGNLYAALGDGVRAERYYRDALAVDELFYPAKVNLAMLLNGQGRNDEAERLLREVAQAYPEEYQVAYSLGLLLAEMQRVDEAVEFLGRAADGMPGNARIGYNHGLALQAVGRLAEAGRVLERVLELDSTNLDFQFALADHYLKRGDYRRALGMAERIGATHPESPVGPQVRAVAEAALRGGAAPR